MQGSFESIEFLLKNGANKDFKNGDINPYTVAGKHRGDREAVIKLLDSY